MRKACKTSQIFLVVPFGRFMEDAIVSAYQSYQATSNDSLTSLIQMGERASVGLSGWGATFAAGDGIHPWAWKSSQLGALLASKIIPVIQNTQTKQSNSKNTRTIKKYW